MARDPGAAPLLELGSRSAQAKQRESVATVSSGPASLESLVKAEHVPFSLFFSRACSLLFAAQMKARA
eukprot:6204965-Pleurochrysis_carterae.AAC.4